MATRTEPASLAAATIEATVARRAQVAAGAQAGVVQVTAAKSRRTPRSRVDVSDAVPQTN